MAELKSEEERDYEAEIEKIIDSNISDDEKRKQLDDYHESDIANVVEKLTKDERIKLYKILGNEKTAEVFSYLEDVDDYVDELDYDKAADIIQEMDADDAVDVLDELDDKDKIKIIDLMDNDTKDDIHLIESYDDDMIGSKMTTNYISISYGSTVKQAMRMLIQEAADNDNVSTIYVIKENNVFYGSIDLRDLIIAREDTNLDDIIKTSYPTLVTTTLVSDCLHEIREYGLDSIPVLNNNHQLVGVITSDDITESVGEELQDDYAKLGGLTENDDLDESTFSSIKKRLPWLIALMFLGLVVSMMLSTFETVIAVLPAIVFFQSMVLDMAGNVGTQSLAVTIRVISDQEDEHVYGKTILKELRVGFLNGLILGVVSFIFVFAFLCIRKQPIVEGDHFMVYECLKAAGIVGISLLVAMTASSIVGSFVPILLTKIHVDPAVASGPFITTLNDLLAIAIYYGLAWLLFLVL